MQEKFRDKYRKQTNRLRNWDYSSAGAYFVTICIRNGEYYFGDIKNRQIRYSKLGKIAKQCFIEIPIHYPNVVINEFVVMPNHVHGLIIITDNKNRNVETQNFASLQQRKNHHCKQNKWQPNIFGPQSGNLGAIMRGYKTGVTKYANSNEILFDWQPKYHDHIVRNKNEFYRIKTYIKNNIKNWDRDKNNSNGIFM